MGFLFKKDREDEVDSDKYYVLEKQLLCLVCGHDRFFQGKALLNTGLLTFLNLEWLNGSAVYLECKKCGYIHWFRPQ